jgi:hypothetical protein
MHEIGASSFSHRGRLLLLVAASGGSSVHVLVDQVYAVTDMLANAMDMRYYHGLRTLQ